MDDDYFGEPCLGYHGEPPECYNLPAAEENERLRQQETMEMLEKALNGNKKKEIVGGLESTLKT